MSDIEPSDPPSDVEDCVKEEVKTPESSSENGKVEETDAVKIVSLPISKTTSTEIEKIVKPKTGRAKPRTEKQLEQLRQSRQKKIDASIQRKKDDVSFMLKNLHDRVDKEQHLKECMEQRLNTLEEKVCARIAELVGTNTEKTPIKTKEKPLESASVEKETLPFKKRKYFEVEDPYEANSRNQPRGFW